MNCIIIEDDLLSQESILRHCKNYGSELNVLGVFGSAESAKEFINSSEYTIDLIFTDVVLPGKNGLDFISELLIIPYVILTTAHDKYAVKAFDLNVADYLKKPILYSRFEQSLKKVENLIDKDSIGNINVSISIKSNGEIKRFLIQDIDYIESFSDYVKIYIKNQGYLHLIALKDILKKLPAKKFIQIHRRYIINTDKIKSIDKNMIYLKGYENLPLPISRAKRKEFLGFLTII